MSWLARDSADHGTLWAATSAGRIFVTHNADAVDPATVVWHRIDNATSPTRFPSGIYVDPADTGHAWVSYSGYNAVTPSTPGHVFEVKENGTAPGSGVFTNLNVESGTSAYPTPTSNGDLPVSDVVRDDSSKTLYVSTDFGVLRGDNDGTGGWHVTAGMPRYEVMHLEIQPSARVPTCTPAPKCKRCCTRRRTRRASGRSTSPASKAGHRPPRPKRAASGRPSGCVWATRTDLKTRHRRPLTAPLPSRPTARRPRPTRHRRHPRRGRANRARTVRRRRDRRHRQTRPAPG